MMYKEDLIGKYCYSTNEENFHGACDSIEDALIECEDYDCEAEHCWIGEIIPVDTNICGYDTMERVSEQVYEQVGEYADSWPDIGKKEITDILGERLTKVFQEWLIETNNIPNFHAVDAKAEYYKANGKWIKR